VVQEVPPAEMRVDVHLWCCVVHVYDRFMKGCVTGGS
jgi:hypothetical protein